MFWRKKKDEDPTVAFQRAYYDSRVWMDTRWLGAPAQKCPLDMWIYQEIIFEQRPTLILETGTYSGGSTLFMASILDLLGAGRVISIDIHKHDPLPQHPRITYMLGRSSTDVDVLREVGAQIQDDDKVMVVLDSDHSKDHVVHELEAYSPLATVGQFLIVEDTNVNGHPVYPEHGPGPMEALEEWLPRHSGWEQDRHQERFMMTQNPGGFLRRLA